MKKINSISILFFNIIILLFVLNIYRYTNTDINEAKKEYLEVQRLSVSYKDSKNSLYVKQEVRKKVSEIAKNINIKNISILKRKKRLIIKTNESSPYKQDKFLNKILNEKFNILKLQIEQNNLEIEIGL